MKIITLQPVHYLRLNGKLFCGRKPSRRTPVVFSREMFFTHSVRCQSCESAVHKAAAVYDVNENRAPDDDDPRYDGTMRRGMRGFTGGKP